MNRRHNRFISVTILLLTCIFGATAQIPVGSFRTHLSFYGAHSIAVAPDAVYAACENGVIYYDKQDEKEGGWSKVDGLSESSVTQVYYEPNSRYLVVAYDNANIDFIRDGKLTNLPDIKNKVMTGSKEINDILYQDGLLYLSCSFGIVSIDLEQILVRDTWYSQTGETRREVNTMQIYDGEYYLFTNHGIYHTPVDNPAAADFSMWQFTSEMGNNVFHRACIFNGKLYAAMHIDDDRDSLLMYDGSQWRSAGIHISPIQALACSDEELLVGSWNFVQTYNADGDESYFVMSDDRYSWPNVQDAAFDGSTIWIADDNNGLVRHQREWGKTDIVTINGPFSSSAYRLDCVGGIVALAPGGVTNTWNNSWTAPNFSYFENQQWHNILQKDNFALANTYDLTAVAINPRNTDEMYVGTFWTGLVKCNRDAVVASYNRDNSPLQSRDTMGGRIGGLAFDKYGNLWASCSYSSIPLAVLKTDGTWASFPLSSYISGYNTTLSDILIDSRGYKWIVKPRDNTIVVLDDNGTIDNRTDDRLTSVKMNAAANIETSAVNCVVEDKNGQIWIGCNLGIKVIYTPGKIFDGGVYPQNVLVEQINYVQNLFEFEEVTSIAVDDANRKWVGTGKSGVYLISADGKEQLEHFTEENSPLLANKIYHINIERESGEVFIATSKGLVSYRGTASQGREDYSDVVVFPNPVRENYHGIITVSGLMENSFCKIADAAGNLVWQGYANGGTLAWDGYDLYGNKPATGVYFVFASSSDGKQKKTAKILFVK